MKSGVPNLNDVAKQAGVSKSTVSRILNNRLGNGFSVKEEVRLLMLAKYGLMMRFFAVLHRKKEIVVLEISPEESQA